MPPRRFKVVSSTPKKNPTTPDSRFTKLPKFYVADQPKRNNDIQPVETPSESNAPLINEEQDSIQDLASLESGNEHVSNVVGTSQPGPNDEMLFDNFVEPDAMPWNTTSPARKKQRTNETHDEIPAIPQFTDPQPLPFTPIKGTGHPYRYISTPKTEQMNHYTPSRPTFLDPHPIEDSIETSLSALLSPHRKSQKFIPSGLASSMRTVIIEATSVHGQSAIKAPNEVRYRVQTASLLSGLIAIECQTPDKNFLVVNHGTTPVPGQVISIKGVTWNVTLEDRERTVVLNWAIEG